LDNRNVTVNQRKHLFFAQMFLRISCAEIMKLHTYYDDDSQWCAARISAVSLHVQLSVSSYFINLHCRLEKGHVFSFICFVSEGVCAL
jgi:hypothetical protein